jgi:hypothetical protein
VDRVVPLRGRVPVAEVQGTLALDLLPHCDPPTLVPEQQQPEADVVPIDRRLRRRLDAWAGRFGQAAVEIVGGDRPASQLLRWTSAEVYADLERRARLVARAGQHQPGQARVQPVRPKVVGVHTSFVTPAVVEASLRIRYGERSRALAARFEHQDGRWICTALEFA